MKIKLFLLFLLIASNGFATGNTYLRLCDVNAEWKNNSDGQALIATSEFSQMPFEKWIAAHLMLVEQTLRQRPTVHLTKSQLEKRFNLLDELHGYWQAGSFPINDYLSFKNPVFIDRNGTHCAVGYLMKQSGASSLANAIDADNKFVFVKDILTKGVNEWAYEHGFTIDELAWIQPGYPPVSTADALSGGLNDAVNVLAMDPGSQILYAGGSFTQSEIGNPCQGVAAYISGIAGYDWMSVGNGLNGTVNALLFHNNKLYAGGNFSMSGTVPVYNVAEFDFTTGQWQSMGMLDSTVNDLVVYNNEIYAGGYFTGHVSKWTGSQWQDVTGGWLGGEGVRCLEVWQNTLIIGGRFDLPTSAYRKNVATYDGVYMGSLGFGTATPVNDFAVLNDTLYAGCDFYEGTDSCVLSRFDNGDWNTVLKPYSATMDYLDGIAVRDLLVAGGKLFAAGDFFVSSGFIYGNHLFELANSGSSGIYTIPLMIGDAGLRTLADYYGTLSFGGEISVVGGDSSVNHVGVLTSVTLGILNPDMKSISIRAFPNPTQGKITLVFDEPADNRLIKISDVNGREIYSEKTFAKEVSFDLSARHAEGIYLLQVFDSDGQAVASRKLVVY